MPKQTKIRINNRMPFRHIMVLLAVMFISACGYHLRGSVDLPEGLKRIYLMGASQILTKELKSTLRYSGGQLVPSIAESGVAVQVIKENMDRRVLSLSATGRANEFELIYIIDFMLLDSTGKALNALQKIEISRDYFNDQEDVLAKNNEEKVIREEMYRQAVQALISRAQIALERDKK